MEKQWPEGTFPSRAWNEFDRQIGQLFETIRQDGVKPVAVLIPMKLQIDQPSWERYLVKIHVDKLEPSRFFAQQRIGEILDRFDVDWLDLTPAIENGGAGDLYYALDGHLKPRGHALIANEVASRLGPKLVQRGS